MRLCQNWRNLILAFDIFEDKGYLIQAQIWKLDTSKHRDVRYYFYFFERNGKLYYSYQRIQ